MNDDANLLLKNFTGAVELPVEKRSSFLDQACAGNAELRQKVEKLLRLHERAGDFLSPPVAQAADHLRGGRIGEKANDQIGHYKLINQIGEGGCGVVFLAEQTVAVRRRVALKILKPGMDTKGIIARFEAERQALALMDHPNIAKVFDAGTTESGRPYFVMEMIQGLKITDYCDQHSLSTKERLKLFIQVCHAVQHAHQKGIIHRDLKPSNILVAKSPEGAALPMVIDFGIAKATGSQRLTDKTLLTAHDMLIGTPAYMSPEQAELTSLDVDCRSDIYSLGVLLYEMLTGSTPFDTSELSKAGLDEIRRVIRNEDPLRPSTRLSRMSKEELLQVAGHRSSEPSKLISHVRGDLDWIVVKTLEKDRNRRYETANELAMDVQRYLGNEAITARPPSALYKLQKAASRNKLAVFTITFIALLLVVTLGVVSAALEREQQAHRKAEIEAAKSQEVTAFLENMLRGVGPSVALGRDTKMLREILDQTATQVGSLTNQPEVEAHLRSLIGRLYKDIGVYDQSERMHRAALAIDEKEFGPDSLEAGQALNDLGAVLAKEKKDSEAQTVEEQALAIERRTLPEDSSGLADTLGNLSDIYRHQRKDSEAEPLTYEALKIRRKLFGDDSLEAAKSLRSLSIILGDQGHWPEAEATAREVLAIRRKRLGPEHPLVADSLNDVAWTLGAQGKADGAESLERQALEMRQRLLGADHPEVAASDVLLANRLWRRGELSQADLLLNSALTIQKKTLGETNLNTLYTSRNLSEIQEAEGNWPVAEQTRRFNLTMWQLRGEQDSEQARIDVEGLAKSLIVQSKFKEAKNLLDTVLTPASLGQSSSGELLYLRSSLEGRRSQFKEAAMDAGMAFRWEPADNSHFCQAAALLVIADDQSAYKRLREQLLSNYLYSTNPFEADQVAKACLFVPAPKSDMQNISRLADVGVLRGSGDEGALPYFQISKALSEYRESHFKEAVDWAQQAYHSPMAGAHEHAAAILAMGYWRLGQESDARRMLATAQSLAPSEMPANVASDPGDAWLAWLFARIQISEAESLIQPLASRKD